MAFSESYERMIELRDCINSAADMVSGSVQDLCERVEELQPLRQRAALIAWQHMLTALCSVQTNVTQLTEDQQKDLAVRAWNAADTFVRCGDPSYMHLDGEVEIT